jgi:hypothetical protein
MFAAPILIDRLMTNFSAGVAEMEIELNPRWQPNTETNRH